MCVHAFSRQLHWTQLRQLHSENGPSNARTSYTCVHIYLQASDSSPAAVPWALERLREDLPALIEYDECKQTKCKRCSACKERIESAALDSFQLIGKRVCGHDAFRCAAGKGKVDSNGLHCKLAQTWTQHHRLRHQ